MEWNRFDICEAYYLYCRDNHQGQWSKEYEVLGRLINMRFKPGINLEVDELTENGKQIYDNLVSKEEQSLCATAEAQGLQPGELTKDIERPE